MATEFTTQTTIGVNADATSTTTGLEITENGFVSMQIIANTGTHATHIIDIQCSTNNSNWHDVTGGSVTGVGIVDSIQVTTQFVRARVSTVEGVASTVNIILQAK